ncbi:MAG TPA: efflux transporter periplasmic adaptor subunit [Peptococcaceae bacterium]|nr:MAG: Secretion protein HlyD family protein [Clostridia bacterium 41_269]HBT20625.1 efflux transporter periplasmic adaptor subunit [Peptococcaceae bacterium]
MDAFSTIKLKKLAVVVLAAALLFGGYYIFNNYFYENEQAQAKDKNKLTAVGTVEAVSANASFKMAGRIEKMYVKEGDRVEKGQILAVLDNSEIRAKIAQAEGAYEAALGQVEAAQKAVAAAESQVEAKIAQLKAKVAQAEVGLSDAKQKHERAKQLHDGGVISDAQYDEAVNNLKVAESTLKEAQAALQEATAAKKNIEVAKANYEAALGQSRQAEGAIQEAKAYLNNTYLRAPMSGYITDKFLEEGELVNAGTPVFEISDLKNTYVKVFVSEDKIGRVFLNQEAEITVDAFPDRVFKGKVTWISSAGEFAVKKAVSEMDSHDIRSFEVKIEVPNPDLELKVGMTAEVKFIEKKEGCRK